MCCVAFLFVGVQELESLNNWSLHIAVLFLQVGAPYLLVMVVCIEGTMSVVLDRQSLVEEEVFFATSAVRSILLYSTVLTSLLVQFEVGRLADRR